MPLIASFVAHWHSASSPVHCAGRVSSALKFRNQKRRRCSPGGTGFFDITILVLAPTICFNKKLVQCRAEQASIRGRFGSLSAPFPISQDPAYTMPETDGLLSKAASGTHRPLQQRLREIVADYSPLALITFGGPAAHIAILHDRFVVNKRWLSEKMFTELFAISSALPGPASTQLAYTVALIRDGVVPAIFAFLLWR